MKFTLHSFIYFTHQNNGGERDLFQWVDVGLFYQGFGESAWCKEVGISVLQCKSLRNPVIPQEKLTRLGKQRVYSSRGQCFVFFPFTPIRSGCDVNISESNGTKTGTFHYFDTLPLFGIESHSWTQLCALTVMFSRFLFMPLISYVFVLFYYNCFIVYYTQMFSFPESQRSNIHVNLRFLWTTNWPKH